MVFNFQFSIRKKSNDLFVRLLLWLAPALAESFGDNPLQLTIDAAELIGSPLFEGVHSRCIYSEYKTLGVICGVFRHKVSSFGFALWASSALRLCSGRSFTARKLRTLALRKP